MHNLHNLYVQKFI